MKIELYQLIIFVALAVIVAGSNSQAQDEQRTLPYDPTITVQLDSRKIEPTAFRRDLKNPSSDREVNLDASKLACRSEVTKSIDELHSRLRDYNRSLYIENLSKDDTKGVPKGDLEYYCRSLVFTATPSATVTRPYHKGQSYDSHFLLFPIYKSFEIVETETSGGSVVMGCERRSFEEKLLLSMTRRCEVQPTEGCMSEAFLSRARTLRPLRHINMVDVDAICGLTPARRRENKD